MGKRPAEIESLEGNMSFIRRKASYAKSGTAGHGNETRMNSSESIEAPAASVALVSPVPVAASTRCAVNQLPKGVVWEIHTLGG